MNEPGSASLRPVLITTAVASCFAAAYGFISVWNPDLRPPALVDLVVSCGPVISVVLWVQHDARLRRIAAIQDWGFFLYLFFPVLVPRHVLLTRGRRAWPLATALVAACVAPIAGAATGIVIAAVVRAFGPR